MSDPKVIVALDFPDTKQATALVSQLDASRCRLKVGKELFVRGGPQFVEAIQLKGFDVFLDLKFHDIPNTVAAACRAAADLGVWMVNVHAIGGQKMMQAAAEAIATYQHRPLLIAVTILNRLRTSIVWRRLRLHQGWMVWSARLWKRNVCAHRVGKTLFWSRPAFAPPMQTAMIRSGS